MAVFYVPALASILVPLLLVLSAGKFALVVMFTISVPLTLITIIPVPVVAYVGLKSRHPQLPIWWLVMARQAGAPLPDDRDDAPPLQ